MLKFKKKKKTHFPKFSLLIWVLALIAIIFTLYFDKDSSLNKQFAIVPATLAENLQQSWWYMFRLVTSLFLHGNLQHWAGNMLLFLIIALSLEKRVGGFWFLVIYFVSGFAANISSIYQLIDSSRYLLGASGAVSGLLGAWLLLFPRQKVSVVIPIGLYLQRIKVPIIVLAIIWLSLQIILQVTSNQNHPIVWGSHIVGFFAGFIMAWLYRVTA